MKRIIKNLVLIILLVFSCNVSANSVSSISMNIYVDNNGDAHVTEIWNANLNSGTEGYKPYYNLGDSEIKDFKVIMDDVSFTPVTSWNVNANFNSKAYKNGIHKISDGVELCFGISKYGKHNYVMTYTITNFVHKLEDSEMIYFSLMPHDFSNEPDNVYIKIYSDFKYEDTLDVWGYGYEGYAYVYEGYIEMSTQKGLDSDEYMVVLVKFPLGTFNNLSTINKDFNYYYDMAEEGAVHRDGDSVDVFAFIISIFAIVFQLFFWGVFIFIIGHAASTGNQKYKLNFGKEGKKLKDVPNFRDIPCNKDIFRAYYIAYNFGLMKKQTDLLGAVLLKWTKEKKIAIEKIDKQGLFSKEKTSIVLGKGVEFENGFEKELYDMLYAASLDGILESKEFEKWCKNHYSRILKWFTAVLDTTAANLMIEGKIEKVQKKFIINYNEYHVTDSLREEAKQLKGLKNFLNDFTNIKNREAIEVHLFDEYLMFASIFGIANKVAKQFKELYPDYITDYDYDNVVFINNISYTGVRAASVAKSRAESYSSGGGGFSSSGGGGGSFGGGGGGGGFR